jgi:hypothetical protein
MAGANAVLKGALGRTRAGSSFKSTTGRRTATVADGSGKTAAAGGNSGLPGMHLATTGPGSAPKIPTATAEARTFRGFAPKK